MQQHYLQAVNRDEYLKKEFERQQRLQEDSVNAAKTYQDAKAAYYTNLVEMQSLKRKLELINIDPGQITYGEILDSYPVTAPIPGYVSEIKVNNGKHISSQGELFHITANEKAHIDLSIYEKDIEKITAGQKITFNVANNPVAKSMEGEIFKISRNIDPVRKTALAHAKISKPDAQLLPGMSVSAYIQTGGREFLSLPETAFVADQGKDYIFMLKRQGRANMGHSSAIHEEGEEHGSGEEIHSDEEEAGSGESVDYFIFEKVPVIKEITDGGFTGFIQKENMSGDALYIVNNAQAALSEMQKNLTTGHAGHIH